MSFAYLVVFLDTRVIPARAIRAGIYSASAKGLTTKVGEFPVDVQLASGRDFAKARANLVNMLDNDIGRLVYGWALDMVPADQKQR
jgi:hypothetical protein